MPKASPPIVEVITEGILAVRVIKIQKESFIGKPHNIGHHILKRSWNQKQDIGNQIQPFFILQEFEGTIFSSDTNRATKRMPNF